MGEEPINPYAPPKSDWVHAPNPSALMPQQWWLEGDSLVVLREGSLPTDLCVKTGQPTDLPPIQRKLQWIHPAVAISVVFSPIIFLILYLIFRKTAKLTYGVSAGYLKRRKIGLAAIFAPLAVLLLSLFTQNPVAIVVSLLGFLVGLIAGIRMTMPFQLRKIDKERIYLKIDDRFRQALATRR